MRILILTQHWFPDVLGGAYRVARDQAVGLASAGHDVTLCALGVVGEADGKTRIDGVTVYRYGKKTTRMFGMTAGVLWRLPRLIRSLWGKKSFERVIVHDPYSAAALRRVDVDVPTLYVFHASIAKEAVVEGLARWQHGWKKVLAPCILKRFIKKTTRLETLALTHASAVAVFSEYSERVLQEAYPEINTSGFIMPIGIRTDVFAPAADRNVIRQDLGMIRDHFYFVTARRLTPRMGIYELIHAMSIVHREMPHARLIIAGDGPLRSALEHEAMQLELDGVVQFVGTLSGEELVSLYQAADCFVLPTQSFETFGLATAEALSTGLLVVGTPIGATPEILKPLDANLLTANTTPQAIASTMMQVASMIMVERERVGKQARAYVTECFGMKVSTAALIKILAQL